MPVGLKSRSALLSFRSGISDERQILATLATLARDAPVAGISRVPGAAGADFIALSAVGEVEGYKPPRQLSQSNINRLTALSLRQESRAATVNSRIAAASRAYARRASVADTEATVGSAAAILLLVAGFRLVYRRSRRARSAAQRLSRENARLAATRGEQARTDALTGLGNRRALNDDLATALSAGEQVALTLALFDLDGFKNYNDTFCHPAGDALLARLGEGLQAAMNGAGAAYRMGGDEFCIVTPIEQPKAAALVALAAAALTETGDGFQIGCSYGTAMIPQEASTPGDALHIADQRMYELKASRASASRQSTDVLLTVLNERNGALREHLIVVATLAVRTAQQLELPAHEIKQTGLAAELHDVGKTAIPDAILDKPGPLNKEEWAFMHRHTLIGERIILAAPHSCKVRASYAQATNATTARAIPTSSQASRFRSARASSPSATRLTR
jgi:diguanylate cyclase (GGDEF)-like protein